MSARTVLKGFALIGALLCSSHLSLLHAQDDIVLHTVGGQSLAGRWAEAEGGRLGFRAPEFSDVLAIRPENIDRIELQTDTSKAKVGAGEFEFQLRSGERLQGQLLGVTSEAWTVDVRGVGSLSLPSSQIVAAENLGGDGFILHSLNGMAGWKQRSKKVNWESGGEVLFTDSAKAGLERDLDLEGERNVEFTLAWSGEPHFRVGLGHRFRASGERVITLEPWGSSLVVWRDDGRSGFEVVELTANLRPDSRIFLRAELRPDVVTFFGEGGEALGSLARSEREKSGPYLSIVSDGGRLELRSLRVTAPGEQVTPKRLLAASVQGYDAESGCFQWVESEDLEGEPVDPEVSSTEGELREIARGEVLGIDFAPDGEVEEPRAGEVWLSYVDGRRMGGQLQSTTSETIILLPRWCEAPLECSLEGLQKLQVVRAGDAELSSDKPSSFLVTSGGEIAGELDSIHEDGHVIWKPKVSDNPASINPETVKRVVLNRTTSYYVSNRKFPHYLRLRNGVAFRCKLLSITGESIRYTSPFGGERALAVSEIKAVEFDVRSMERFREIFTKKDEPDEFSWGTPVEQRRETSEGFDADSLERAMSLPRKYKKKPFQHLILARNGDFLRTKLLGWDAGGARYPGQVEEARTIPSKRIAAILWLSEDSKEEREPLTCRVKLDDFTRIDLALSGSSNGKLRGTSVYLGDLEIDLESIISIDLDPEVLAAPGPYDEWVLKPKKEPFPDQPEKTAAPTLSDKAPKTQGQNLDGEDLALSDYRGKVVLLNFWAHW